MACDFRTELISEISYWCCRDKTLAGTLIDHEFLAQLLHLEEVSFPYRSCYKKFVSQRQTIFVLLGVGGETPVEGEYEPGMYDMYGHGIPSLFTSWFAYILHR